MIAALPHSKHSKSPNCITWTGANITPESSGLAERSIERRVLWEINGPSSSPTLYVDLSWRRARCRERSSHALYCYIVRCACNVTPWSWDQGDCTSSKRLSRTKGSTKMLFLFKPKELPFRMFVKCHQRPALRLPLREQSLEYRRHTQATGGGHAITARWTTRHVLGGAEAGNPDGSSWQRCSFWERC